MTSTTSLAPVSSVPPTTVGPAGVKAATAATAAAATAAPSAPFTQCPPVGRAPSCGILIVVNPDGSTAVLGDGNVGPYDGGDDTLVGVQNNTTKAISGLKLSSSLPIFDLDGDGICGGFSPSPPGCPFGPTGYEGPNTNFSSTSGNSGNVLFTNGGLAPGASTYFGLESVVQAAQLLVNTTHYRVDLKAWIPQAEVVDPEQPVTLPYLASAVIHSPCYTPGFPESLLLPVTTVSTRFLGDGHAGFDGSYRVQSSVEFDWDGRAIMNIQVPPETHFGTSHLVGTYQNLATTTTCELARDTATSSTGSSAAGSSFSVSYSATNPVVRVPAPAIDGQMSGTVAADGTISLQYQTDLFPSHGLRVSKDGQPQLTDIVNDVSCLSDSEVTGAEGALLIGSGLTFETNSGARTVAPGDLGRTDRTASPLCLATFIPPVPPFQFPPISFPPLPSFPSLPPFSFPALPSFPFQ